MGNISSPDRKPDREVGMQADRQAGEQTDRHAGGEIPSLWTVRSSGINIFDVCYEGENEEAAR